MYFKKLEIFGFKSFADKTTLNFEKGITAIIGPNGCGKSNIFDAIRWVLGEQSVKELRGSAMEDVIFNGTDKKPALGFAEVSLTFSNEAKMLAVDYDEVTVTRRLFRSGESEYLMNKVPVRLRDIAELFMGTGIGAEAYSLVQQGKVDLVVSARPEDRRIILDEAAGITKYKSKRKEALSKLKDTENNLLRINDIIVEVKRQIASLERQASKARRYKEEFERLKGLETRYARYEIEHLAQQRLQMKALLEEWKAQEARLNEELAEFTERIQHENNFFEDLEDKLNEIRAEDIKLDGQIDVNQRQIAFNEERIENATTTQTRLEEQRTQLVERCRVQSEKVAEVQQALAGIDDLLQRNLSSLQEQRGLLQAVVRQIEQANHVIRSEEERILDISARQVQIKNRLTETMKEVQGALARKRRLELENAKVSSEKGQVDQKLIDIDQKIDSTKSHIAQLQTQLNEQNQVLSELTAQTTVLDQDIDELEKNILFLKSQKEFIEKLRVQYQDIPDPVVEGRMFTPAAPLEHHTGIIGKVKSVSRLDEARQQAIKANSPEILEPLFEVVCEAKFIELDPQQISGKMEELNRVVGEKQAQREVMALRSDEQQRVVTQIGLAIQEQEKSFSIFEAQKSDVKGEVNKLSDELSLLRGEWEEAAGNLNSAKKTEEDLSRQLDLLSQELSFSQIKIREQQELNVRKAEERQGVTVAIAQLETEIASVEDRRSSLDSNFRVLSETLLTDSQEINRIEEETAQLEEKKQQYRQDADALVVAIEDVRAQKESWQGVAAGYEKQKDEILQKINSLRSNIAAYNTETEEIKNRIHQQQMSEQEVGFKEKEIKDRLSQAYRIEWTSLEAPVEDPAVAESPMSIDEVMAAIEQLRKKCDAFGSVNLVAIDEFDELKGRFEFLTKQQSDLITAKESLHQTITKINRQTRQMFMDTFTKVSEEFRIYFRMLFGGGEAQLVLLDPENVLESGIEIIARPPGKKLQNISLLSGGEKTLTAIALIFGVFKVNPSPFCVLDEIDAALDESNVGRFSYLLKDFSQIAQFIVITHNKKTIASSDVMYGITMQETGVSKIVSVKFGEKDGEPKAAQEIPASV